MNTYTHLFKENNQNPKDEEGFETEVTVIFLTFQFSGFHNSKYLSLWHKIICKYHDWIWNEYKHNMGMSSVYTKIGYQNWTFNPTLEIQFKQREYTKKMRIIEYEPDWKKSCPKNSLQILFCFPQIPRPLFGC